MEMPNLTHMQFLTLTSLVNGQQFGIDIRNYLAQRGVEKSLPNFYQSMERLEAAGYISGDYRERVVEGQRIRERFYWLEEAGRAALNTSKEFYLSLILEAGLDEQKSDWVSRSQRPDTARAR